ncbi:MAG: YmaF family protein [Clostridiaceae bacterium]|nr:YmaF family protein [Clostridiaceae bacterium]
MAQHSHSFSGITTFNKDHIHHYGGVTAKATSGVPHVHNMEGITTYNLEHEHPYVTRTGPAIFLPNGLHYHYFETRVEYVKEHTHYISGYTSAD